MDAPTTALAERKRLLEQARELLGRRQWSEAEQVLREAISIDEHHAPSHGLMAQALAGKGEPEQSAQWKERAELVRRQAWQKEVEAEARGKHDLLGEPARHEIP